MTAGAWYLLVVSLRARVLLFPTAAVLLAAVGVYADPYNEVASSWALMSVLACGLACWLMLATLTSQPAAQAEMAEVAMGGPAALLGAKTVLALIYAATLAALFVAYPLALDQVTSRPVFDRHIFAADWEVALLAILASGVLGGLLGVLCAHPRRVRPPVDAALAMVVLLALAGLGSATDLGGPVAAARAFSDARPSTLTGQEAEGVLSTLVLAIVALGLVAACAGAPRMRTRTTGNEPDAETDGLLAAPYGRQASYAERPCP